jgi:hypothetical protein
MNIDPNIPDAASQTSLVGDSKAFMPTVQPLPVDGKFTWVKLRIPAKSHTPTHQNLNSKHYTVLLGQVFVVRFNAEGVAEATKQQAGSSFTVLAGTNHFLISPAGFSSELTMWRDGDDKTNAKWQTGSDAAPAAGQVVG